MSLGGPLPRAKSPRAGRVLSRGKDCRTTEPPMASRPIRVTPATAAPAVPSTIHFSSLATAASTARAAQEFGAVHTSARTRINSLRLERVCSPSSAFPRCYRSSLPQFPLAGHVDRAMPSVGLCVHGQDDFGPPPLRPSTSCRSRRAGPLSTCPLRPSPADQCATVRQSAP